MFNISHHITLVASSPVNISAVLLKVIRVLPKMAI